MCLQRLLQVNEPRRIRPISLMRGFLWAGFPKTCTFIILDEVFADELRACLLSAPSTSTPSASAVASEGTGVVESTKVAPLEPEKITYA